MKAYPVILLFLLSFFVFSCTDTLSDIGKGIQSASDQISVGTDTFHLKSSTVFVDYITSRPDSFLLGTFYDPKFGSIQADILAQVKSPEGWKFPTNSKVDSVKISLFYNSSFGSTTEPLDINIYEMDKQTFLYTGIYKSNLNPLDYTTLTKKLGERIISAGTNSSLTKIIDFKLDTNSTFVKGLRNEINFRNDDAFNAFFGGMYITTKFGASTLLNVGLINLQYYYHYTYKTKNIYGGDSTVIVKDHVPFPANSEVRQVNRIQHPDRASVVQPTSDVNYLASPSNLQTQIILPLNTIQTRLKAGVNGKKLSINSALLRVDVADTEQDTILHPVVRYVLLIKDRGHVIDDFFNNKELPSDTCSVLAVYTTALKIGTSNVYEHYYTFNVAKLIANEMKNAAPGKPIDPLNVRLIPVAVSTSTNSNGATSVSSVKQQYLMDATTIMSGSNSVSPMRLNVVYSGF